MSSQNDFQMEKFDRVDKAEKEAFRKLRRSANAKNGDELVIDYKDVNLLRYFITDRGKIIPRRVSNISAKQQRELTLAIKRARVIALLPFTTNY